MKRIMKFEMLRQPVLLAVFFVVLLINCHGVSVAEIAESSLMPSPIVAVDRAGSTVIIVEKSSQTLFLYSYNGRWNEEYRLTCSTGKAKGRKSRSGDQKTPEGVYFFTGKYLKKDLSPTYGIMALPTDYPNPVDVLEGRTGNSIWLHGTNKTLVPRDSNGCVALEDRNVERVDQRISLELTPIIITDSLKHVATDQNIRITGKIDGLLGEWQKSIATGEYHEFLSFYSPDFLPDMSWWNQWRTIRSRWGKSFTVNAGERSVFRSNGVYVVQLKEILKAGGNEKYSGMRKLYLKEYGDSLKIIGDAYNVIHSLDSKSRHEDAGMSPLLAAGQYLAAIQEKKVEDTTRKTIKTMIAQWADAWESGNIELYGTCYADSFTASGMDKKAWLDRKRYLSKVYDYIDIEVTEPVIEIEEEKITARFRQSYRSSGYSAEGQKTLVLVNEGKQWKIIQEIWKRN